MGYEISVDHAEIHIRKENFSSVLNAIASIPDRMAWTELADIQRIAKSGDIGEMFEHLGWPVEFDSEGNIVRMEFDSSKMGDEEVWLGAIAPYVESGCIQIRGEDGDLWRWILSGGKLKEIRPDVGVSGGERMSPEEQAARIVALEAQVAALKEIAVEGWAVAEFGGEQEGQDYHLYFREWNIDRESYRKEALELLQAEHPEAFR